MNFSVNLNIRDILIFNCLKNTNNSDITINSTSQSVSLQNNYRLNVVAVTSSYVTVVIQNGTYALIRRIYTNYTMNICVPTEDCCSKHIVCIGVNSISLDGW